MRFLPDAKSGRVESVRWVIAVNVQPPVLMRGPHAHPAGEVIASRAPLLLPREEIGKEAKEFSPCHFPTHSGRVVMYAIILPIAVFRHMAGGNSGAIAALICEAHKLPLKLIESNRYRH
jgi:hypothetical protein